MTEKPEIDFPGGEPPEDLEVRDLVRGEGDEATPGAEVLVHHLGVDFGSGEEFDSSWGRWQPVRFPLTGLIKGWQEGIPGMRVGGRRELVCAPRLADD